MTQRNGAGHRLQAKAYNKGLKLLPAAMLSRFQHHTVCTTARAAKLAPADLAGKRIGVRSYSQTTGVYIRGILENDYGVDLARRAMGDLRGRPCRRSQRSADGVIRAQPGQDITQMLIDGELDAAIYGAAMPDDPRLKTRDPRSGCRRARLVRQAPPRAGQSHGGGDRRTLARAQPEAIAEFYRLLEAGKKAAGGLPKAGRNRRRAVRPGGQSALPGIADLVCGPAGPDPAASSTVGRALVGYLETC